MPRDNARPDAGKPDRPSPGDIFAPIPLDLLPGADEPEERTRPSLLRRFTAFLKLLFIGDAGHEQQPSSTLGERLKEGSRRMAASGQRMSKKELFAALDAPLNGLSPDDIQYAGEVDAAMSRRPTFSARALSVAVALLFAVLLVWAAVASLDEVTHAEGSVVGSRRTQSISNLEGGILRAILVNEGDIVEKGQIIAQLENVMAESSYRDALYKLVEHRLAILRLEAMLEDAEPQFPSNIAEFLNQADYIAKITEYDRDMLEQYTQTKEEIAAKEEQVSQEKDEIEALRQESVLQQEAVEELVESTYNQIRTYQEELAGAQSQESQLLTEIEQQNEEINSLLRQAKEEEAAAQLAAQKAAEEKAAQEAAAKEAEEEAARQAAEKAQQDAADAAAEETKRSSSQDSSSQNAASGSSSSSQKQETGTSSQENTSSDSSTQSSADTSQGKYLGRFKLTAYCTCSICCGSWAGGSTASGTTPTPGRTIAMGGVPFGTKLMINGTVYTVEDRGTAYGHVDILMGSHSQALQFGLQYADVYLVS